MFGGRLWWTIKDRWLHYRWNRALGEAEICLAQGHADMAALWKAVADKRKAAFDSHTSSAVKRR